MKKSLVSRFYIVPGQAQILLAKERSQQWTSLHNAYAQVRREIEETNPDILVYCSTQWLSVLGYMVQGDPNPKGIHVDPNWHELGTMNYNFKVDDSFAKACGEQLSQSKYTCKVVNYNGFPIDTGTIVAQKLLNPENRFATAMVSCSIYGDQKETENIGKCVLQALNLQNKSAVVVLVSNFSNRYFTTDIDPREDHISAPEDDTWNRRILSLLEKGTLEPVLAETPQFAKEARADMGFKGIWFLSGMLGARSSYTAQVFDYQAVYGTGAALVGLYPENPVYVSTQNSNHISSSAPEAVGPYPHARKEGNFLFLSGIGPRVKGNKEIPGVQCDANGTVTSYDIRVQTHSVFQNVKTILEECGSSMSHVVDCQVFLTNMKKDFPIFNAIYKEYFNADTGPTRTTIEVLSLPTPIAIELKVIAKT